MNQSDKNNPFILSQLEEALEERQNPDRRKAQQPFDGAEDRRKGDRRAAEAKADTSTTA